MHSVTIHHFTRLLLHSKNTVTGKYLATYHAEEIQCWDQLKKQHTICNKTINSGMVDMIRHKMRQISNIWE
jgi:hypothetical protein